MSHQNVRPVKISIISPRQTSFLVMYHVVKYLNSSTNSSPLLLTIEVENSHTKILKRYLLRPCRWGKYCGQRVCLLTCVYLSVYLLVYLKNTCSNFTKFSLHVTCDRGSVLFWHSAIRYAFPVLWMTSYFHIIWPIDQKQARRCFVEFARRRHHGDVCGCFVSLMEMKTVNTAFT